MLFILSRILGNKTFSNQLLSILPNFTEIEPVILTLDNNDYEEYKTNSFLNISNFLESHTVIRKKFRKTKIGSIDIVFIQGVGLVPAFKKLIAEYPTILAHDTTPILSNLLTLHDNNSLVNRMIFIIKIIFYKWFYGNSLKNIEVFLPRTKWCASSLKDHYRITSHKIIVTPASFDLDKWAPLKEKNNSKKILLFVANDFIRKGGDFLIDVFKKHFSDQAILRVISNDKNLENMSFPLGIEVKSGFTNSDTKEFLDLYRTADLMLLPTRHDFLPIVLIEAAAVGLPIIATNLGAISEVVHDNENGYLCSPKLESEEWASKIDLLLKDDAKRNQFSISSREIAMMKFDINIFSKNIENAIKMASLKKR